MKTLYVIRHGPLEKSVLTVVPDEDSVLTDAAVPERLLELLPKEAEVCLSPLRRCRQSWEKLAPHTEAVHLEVGQALREQNLGDWKGKVWDKIDAGAFWQDPFANSPPGGESFQLMAKRASAFVRRKLKAAQLPLLLVTHAGPMQALFLQGLGPALNRQPAFYLELHPWALLQWKVFENDQPPWTLCNYYGGVTYG